MDNSRFVANLYYVLLCFFLNIVKVNHFLYRFIILLHLISSFPLSKSLLVPYAYVSIESIDCIRLSSSELKAIELISSIKTLCLSLLNFCCVSNIILFFYKFFMFSIVAKKLSMSILFFSK